MAELLIALAPLLALIGLALVAMFIPLPALVTAAFGLMGAGLALGVPTGLYYHVLLRRELSARGALPKGWYWRPQKFHAELDRTARRRLTPWFVAGALGFALINGGFALAVTALFMFLRSERAMLP